MSDSRTRQDYLDKIAVNLRDSEGHVQEPDMIDALDEAVTIYSEAFPREIILDKTGDGATYEWAVPSDWSENYSEILSVEYPAGKTGERQPPSLDERYDWGVVVTSTGTYKWRLFNHTPATDDIARFKYTGSYTVESGTNNLPDSRAGNAVINLATSLCFDILVAYYTGSKSGTFGADLMDHTPKADIARQNSERYLKRSGLKDFVDNRDNAELPISIGEIDMKSTMEPGHELLVHTGRRH